MIRERVVRHRALIGTLAVPLIIAGFVVRDLGGDPSGFWDALGLIGVVLFILSLLARAYALRARARPAPSRSDSAHVPEQPN